VYKEIARIHGEIGRGEDEARTLRALLELEPNDREAQQRLLALSSPPQRDEGSSQIVLDEELDEVVIVDDEPSVGAFRPIAPPVAEHEKKAQIERLMAECEVFLRYGLRDKVIAQLNRVLDLDPQHIEAREKLKDAHLKRGEVQSAVTQLLLLSETLAERDPARAGGYLEQAAALSPDNTAVAERLRELRQVSASMAAMRGSAREHSEAVIIVDDSGDDETDFSDLRSSRPGRLGPREVSLATALEGNDEPELLFEEAGDEEPSGELGEVEELGEELVPLTGGEQPDEDLSEELTEALEEADFYRAQRLWDEAREVLSDALTAHPEHPALLAKLAELDAAGEEADAEPEASEAEDRSFAFAQKLAEEAGGATQGPVEVAQVLQQFKDGVKRQVDKSDTATHYDLGIAYMEMGLHAEAIDEFRLCLGRPDKQCTAHTMIGLSYVANGDMASAVTHFKLALDGPVRTAEEELSLWFEIGNASELLGKASEALIWYEKAEERDPSYRDVAARIERLGMIKNAQQEGDEFDAMFDNMIIKD
jgi:tetratricopeptide (TPR) repeat protein